MLNQYIHYPTLSHSATPADAFCPLESSAGAEGTFLNLYMAAQKEHWLCEKDGGCILDLLLLQVRLR